MNGERQRRFWPWILVIVAGLVVMVFLSSFVWRMLNPPVQPFVESDGEITVIQIHVVNASGRNGAGRRVMEYLRERGFDVVELASTSTQQDSSMIIDRIGDRASALKIASVLGMPDSLVVAGIDSMMFVHASVVIGTDLGTLKPFEE